MRIGVHSGLIRRTASQKAAPQATLARRPLRSGAFTSLPPAMTRPLVRVVFALLVLATIAAFFVTQQLKSEFPLVIRFATQPPHFSPNGDHYRDSSIVGFDLSEPAEVTFSITDAEGNEVRRIVHQRRLAGDAKHRFRWDGMDDVGCPVPDGTYRMRVVRRDESRVINSTKEITIDRKPPSVRLLEATPSVIAPGEPGQSPRVRIRYRGPVNSAPEFRVFRTDDGPPRVVRRFRGSHTRSGVWRGEVAAGPDATKPAEAGIYAFTVTVRDRAGNRAVAPTDIPKAAITGPGTGASVRSTAASTSWYRASARPTTSSGAAGGSAVRSACGSDATHAQGSTSSVCEPARAAWSGRSPYWAGRRVAGPPGGRARSWYCPR